MDVGELGGGAEVVAAAGVSVDAVDGAGVWIAEAGGGKKLASRFSPASAGAAPEEAAGGEEGDWALTGRTARIENPSAKTLTRNVFIGDSLLDRLGGRHKGEIRKP